MGHATVRYDDVNRVDGRFGEIEIDTERIPHDVADPPGTDRHAVGTFSPQLHMTYPASPTPGYHGPNPQYDHGKCLGCRVIGWLTAQVANKTQSERAYVNTVGVLPWVTAPEGGLGGGVGGGRTGYRAGRE